MHLLTRLVAVALVAVAFAPACISTETATIVVTFTQEPPDSTTQTEVTIAGQAARVPETEDILRVTVTGGAADVSEPANDFGLFSITVPLLPNTSQVLVLVVDDGKGTTSPPKRWTVVQRVTPQAPPRGGR